jgi:hypothetical protein
MKYDEKNVIVKDVFTQEEIEQLYSAIDDSVRDYVHEKFYQSVSDFKLPDNIRQKIINYCEEISGETDLDIEEYQFSKYKKVIKEDGTVGNPMLFPHYDETFKEPRFTFDYQIKSNTTWPLVVEDKEFELHDNQALTFSGTHQIHWRLKKNFQDGEFIDMLFCHIKKRNSEPKEKDVNILMSNKAKFYMEQYKKLEAE